MTDETIAADIEKNLAEAGVRPVPQGVKARLAAMKAEKAGDRSFTLNDTGVVVTMPNFKPYHAWTKAQRLGDGDTGKVQTYYILELLKFDGERLSLGDYRDLIPAGDHIQIVGEVFGNGGKNDKAADGEDGAGN